MSTHVVFPPGPTQTPAERDGEEGGCVGGREGRGGGEEGGCVGGREGRGGG